METRSDHARVIECRTRDPKVPSLIAMHAKRYLSQVQSQHYHHQSLCTRVQYMKLSEMETRSHHATVIECRTRDPNVPSLIAVHAKRYLSQVQSEQYHHQSLCIRDEYLKLPKVKPNSHCGAVVECRTRDPEVSITNPNGAKKKISHRSNQNYTTTYPSAPE